MVGLALTRAATLAVLFASNGSAVADEMVVVFVIWPATVTMPVMEIEMTLPGLSAGKLQLTLPPLGVQLPALDCTPTNVTVEGGRLLTVDAAGVGPELLTRME